MPRWFTNEEIIEQLQTQWGGDLQGNYYKWQDKAVTYSIPNAPTDGITERIALAFELWDDLIAIDLNPVKELGQINVNYTEGADARVSGTSYYVGTDLLGHDHYAFTSRQIGVGTEAAAWNDNSDFDFGNKGFWAALHEIGHTLGLTHPGPYDSGDEDVDTYADDAVYFQDSGQYTVMSYFMPFNTGANHAGDFGERSWAATPLLHDIMAIQDKYGADYSTRNTDTVYGFNCTANREVFDFTKNTRPVIAIWDGGGNDTLDASGLWGADERIFDQTIDLRQGAFSSIGGLEKNVAIAFKCDIENAVGGAGDDTIYGNELGNGLGGGNGDDVLSGHGGNDTLYGSIGRDTLIGGAGTDTLLGGENEDRFVFKSLADSIASEWRRDVIMDFEQDLDRIDLSGIDADTRAGAAGNQVFTSFVDRFTGAAQQLQWDQIGPNIFVVEADVNGDRNADFSLEIRIVTGGGGDPFLPGAGVGFSPPLSAADFIM